MTDVQKINKILLELGDSATIEDIVLRYLSEESISVATDLNLSICSNVIVPKTRSMQQGFMAVREKAFYLDTYLSGKMYTTEEAAIRALPIQRAHADSIIRVCEDNT